MQSKSLANWDSAMEDPRLDIMSVISVFSFAVVQHF